MRQKSQDYHRPGGTCRLHGLVGFVICGMARYTGFMRIRDVIADDLAAVWRLNEASTPHVSSIRLEDMRWFAEQAHYFRVARHASELAGFLIGLRPGLSYDSPNYRWFSRHYNDFAYVDRVAVSATTRRLGIATRLYEDFAATLNGAVGAMTCEVNIRPANDSSMRFHERFGFAEVGRQETENGTKEVALLELKL